MIFAFVPCLPAMKVCKVYCYILLRSALKRWRNGKPDLRKLVGYQPGDGLTHDICLEIEALYRNECLSEAARANNVGLPFQGQPSGGVHNRIGDLELLVGGQGGKQMDKREGIIQVSQGVYKSGVPTCVTLTQFNPSLIRFLAVLDLRNKRLDDKALRQKVPCSRERSWAPFFDKVI